MEYKPILTIAESEKATVELASMKGYRGPVVVKRLKEANSDIYRLLCHVQNAHLPRIYEVEEQENDILVAEEHIAGENLEEYLEKQTLSDAAKLGLALQLCEAVEFLHAMKPPIIHRDIKPSNILITGKGVLKLIDFDASRNYKENGSSGDTRLLGTVEYAPPEQFGYSQTDIRSDIYSMGVVFHEMPLTEDEKRAEAWIKLVEKCTSFDPKHRFQNVAELKKEIEKLIVWKKEQRKKLATRLLLFVLAAVIVGASAYAIKVAVERNAASEAYRKDIPKQQDKEQNSEIPEDNLVENTAEFYYEYPQDVTAVLNNSAKGHINALYLRFVDRAGYAELERLQAWCYEIADDGISIRIKKEYLAEINRDIGQLDLVVACDNGCLYELAIHILAGLPEGVTADTVVEELTPVEIPESRAELYPNLEKAPQQIWYSYYQSAKTELIIPDDKYREFEVFDYATCYCYQTGLAVDIPADMLQLEYGYIVVAQQFMMSLEPYVYEFSFYYNTNYDRENMMGSLVFEKTVKVYPEETEVLSTGSLLLKSEQTVYTGYPYIITNIIRNGKRSRITRCYVLNQNGEREYPDGDKNLSGRTVWVSAKEFVQYLDRGTVPLYIEFDTGEICEMKINLVEGLPEVLRVLNETSKQPFGEIHEDGKQQDEYSEEIQLAMRQAGRYYKSMPVKSAVIFSHRVKQPQLKQVLCYNYMTEETWEVPLELTESGAGYVCVLGEYIDTLEPALYRFTFVENLFEAEMKVMVYPEEEIPEALSVEHYFMFEPLYYEIGIPAALGLRVPCCFSGVSVITEDGEITIEPEWYTISCNGRFMLIKSDFIAQYEEMEKITLVYYFDNGEQKSVVLSLKNQ